MTETLPWQVIILKFHLRRFNLFEIEGGGLFIERGVDDEFAWGITFNSAGITTGWIDRNQLRPVIEEELINMHLDLAYNGWHHDTTALIRMLEARD